MPDHEAERRPFDARPFAGVAIAVGAVLIGASFLTFDSASRARWSAAQASEYQQAALRLHELSHAHEGAPDGGDAESVHQELAAAQKRYDAIRADLDGARQTPLLLKSVLRWGGVVIAVGGIVAHFAAANR
jgi:hypothetical protein